MLVAVFNAKPYEKEFLDAANLGGKHEFRWIEAHLNADTVYFAKEADAVCAFVNDDLNAAVLETLAKSKVKGIALRCAGFNQVNIEAAEKLGMPILRVPAYSPHAIAEHTLASMLDLNRKIHRAYNRVREGNFSLQGLLGFDFYGLTAGVVGTGRIGMEVIKILKGFGMHILAYDPTPNPDCSSLGVELVEWDELLHRSDVITLHCPLTPKTHHRINAEAIEKMKPGVMLINTSRGDIIDSRAVITGLKSGQIGYLGLDVYEEETDLFFEDLSGEAIQDDVFARLLTFPNVLITGHQAFFTRNAMESIARVTLENLDAIANQKASPNQVIFEKTLAAK